MTTIGLQQKGFSKTVKMRRVVPASPTAGKDPFFSWPGLAVRPVKFRQENIIAEIRKQNLV
jgi:hypothetical protein